MADSNPPATPAPCPACGWTDHRQRRCDYTSHVRLFYGAGDRGAWSIGSRYILKERPDGPPWNEVPAINFLSAHTTIPVPTIARHWVDDQARAFTLTERVQGQTLEDAWSTLSTAKRKRVARETAEYLHQLRPFQSDRLEGFDKGPVHHGLLFGGEPSDPHGPFSSDDEFWHELVGGRGFGNLPEKAKAGMRARLPACQPYTLTHGDLTNCNIIVDPNAGHLSAIIDWEYTGYFPVWWEYACAGIGLSADDADWKDLLLENMIDEDDFADQRVFWRDFWALSRYPDLNERGQAVLDRLMEE